MVRADEAAIKVMNDQYQFTATDFNNASAGVGAVMGTLNTLYTSTSASGTYQKGLNTWLEGFELCKTGLAEIDVAMETFGANTVNVEYTTEEVAGGWATRATPV